MAKSWYLTFPEAVNIDAGGSFWRVADKVRLSGHKLQHHENFGLSNTKVKFTYLK